MKGNKINDSPQEKPGLSERLSDKKLLDELRDRNKLAPEKTIHSWRAPARAFKRRDKEFWLTIAVMVTMGGLVIFLVEGFMPVILIIAVVFLFYILNTVEPDELEYAITNKGIKIGDKKIYWGETGGRFWFSDKFENKILVIETANFPFRLELMVLNIEIDNIKKILKQYLIEEEIPPSKIDKAASWFSKKIPGNK